MARLHGPPKMAHVFTGRIHGRAPGTRVHTGRVGKKALHDNAFCQNAIINGVIIIFYLQNACDSMGYQHGPITRAVLTDVQNDTPI